MESRLCDSAVYDLTILAISFATGVGFGSTWSRFARLSKIFDLVYHTTSFDIRIVQKRFQKQQTSFTQNHFDYFEKQCN